MPSSLDADTRLTPLQRAIYETDQLDLTLRDKKVRAGKVRWALATGIGGATVRDDVPADLVRAVVEAAVTARQIEE